MDMSNDVDSVDEYLKGLPVDVRDVLQGVREVIIATVPECQERIAYKICVYSLKRDLVGFASQENPCSFYTMSPPLVEAMSNELKGYRVSGATIHFTPEEPLPESLLRKILESRVEEMSD
jgi:uncharacterized protein YdhG (YjbR/CyaY superfamily)